MADVRFTIAFAGQVQGVGFRYTTVNVAAGYRVAGWVKNQPDGRVRCVAEGEEAELQRFVAAVQQAMQGHIRETTIDRAAATGEYTGFVVRR